jgi:hypothetical protein
MNKIIKRVLVIIAGLIGAYVIYVGFAVLSMNTPSNSRDNANPINKKEMIEITLKWARLAPFPRETKDFKIYTEGNSLTRTFKGSFTASKESIKKWTMQSPGIQDAKVEVISKDNKRYIIKPGEKAGYAEVIIDYETGKVNFEVSWS